MTPGFITALVTVGVFKDLYESACVSVSFREKLLCFFTAEVHLCVFSFIRPEQSWTALKVVGSLRPSKDAQHSDDVAILRDGCRPKKLNVFIMCECQNWSLIAGLTNNTLRAKRKRKD